MRCHLAILLVLALGVEPESRAAFDPAELEDLVTQTTAKVPEIQRARAIAARIGADAAIYGGTSREIFAFVQEKVEELGSVDRYREWLAGRYQVHLLDWHRLNSDIDILLIPLGSNEFSETSRRKAYGELTEEIARAFPGNIFYRGLDCKASFDPYDPRLEHFEAISNIPIGATGIVRLKELDVHAGKTDTNLAQWGLEQYSRGQFEFEANPSFRGAKPAIASLKQVLRWIRYFSENPRMAIPSGTRNAMREVLNRATRNRSQELDEHFLGNTPTTEGKKIWDALEKLQLYSKDSVRTSGLLAEFGIVPLAQSLGFRESRILAPLAPRDPRSLNTSTLASARKPLGKEVVLYHHTNLAAAQSMSGGSLWKSDNKTIIRGKSTMAALGDGLYAAPSHVSSDYGDFFVEIHLDADAVEGVDFAREGDYWVLKTRNAIAQDASGRLKIQKTTRDSLLEHFMNHYANHQDDTVMRALTSILDPELNSADVPVFEEALRIAASRGEESQFFGSHFSKPHFGRMFLSEPAPAGTTSLFPIQRQRFLSYIESGIRSIADGDYERDSAIHLLIEHFANLPSEFQVRSVAPLVDLIRWQDYDGTRSQRFRLIRLLSSVPDEIDRPPLAEWTLRFLRRAQVDWEEVTQILRNRKRPIDPAFLEAAMDQAFDRAIRPVQREVIPWLLTRLDPSNLDVFRKMASAALVADEHDLKWATVHAFRSNRSLPYEVAEPFFSEMSRNPGFVGHEAQDALKELRARRPLVAKLLTAATPASIPLAAEKSVRWANCLRSWWKSRWVPFTGE